MNERLDGRCVIFSEQLARAEALWRPPIAVGPDRPRRGASPMASTTPSRSERFVRRRGLVFPARSRKNTVQARVSRDSAVFIRHEAGERN